MQVVDIAKILGLLIILNSPMACTLTVLADKIPGSRIAKNTMSPVAGIAVKSVTLTAREESRAPLGVPVNPNRDIGFASVFLRLENTLEKNANLLIQKVEICNVSDGETQNFSQRPQKLYLHPLETSDNAFHLTNATGYSGQDKVKAVIIYKIGSQTYVVESEPVAVERL